MNFKIEIEYSQGNPRENEETLGTMVCFHNKYSLGDAPGYRRGDFSGWEDLRETLKEDHGPCVILPLYLMDHSSLAMSTVPFSGTNAVWDSGQVGFIYCSEARAMEYFPDRFPSTEFLKEILREEVSQYDRWLRGETWEWLVVDGQTSSVLSDGVGDSEQECLSEAKSFLHDMLDQWDGHEDFTISCSRVE